MVLNPWEGKVPPTQRIRIDALMPGFLVQVSAAPRKIFLASLTDRVFTVTGAGRYGYPLHFLFQREWRFFRGPARW